MIKLFLLINEFQEQSLVRQKTQSGAAILDSVSFVLKDDRKKETSTIVVYINVHCSTYT